MTVRILLFASYADAFGAPEIQLELPPAATVGDLVAAVRARKEGKRLPVRPLVAVNKVYAAYDRLLGAQDEVALIPPVAGG